MSDLNIRNVNPDDIQWLKKEAVKAGKTLRQYVLDAVGARGAVGVLEHQPTTQRKRKYEKVKV